MPLYSGDKLILILKSSTLPYTHKHAVIHRIILGCIDPLKEFVALFNRYTELGISFIDDYCER